MSHYLWRALNDPECSLGIRKFAMRRYVQWGNPPILYLYAPED